MIYTLMLIGIIISLFFFVYNKYFVKMQTEVNIVRTLGFIFISLFFGRSAKKNLVTSSMCIGLHSSDNWSEKDSYKCLWIEEKV